MANDGIAARYDAVAFEVAAEPERANDPAERGAKSMGEFFTHTQLTR